VTTARKPSVLLDALAVIAEKGDAVESLARDAYEVSFSSRRVGDEKVRGAIPRTQPANARPASAAA
jgi:hypothetical protein